MAAEAMAMIGLGASIIIGVIIWRLLRPRPGELAQLAEMFRQPAPIVIVLAVKVEVEVKAEGAAEPTPPASRVRLYKG
jgi:hypothetical protein